MTEEPSGMALTDWLSVYGAAVSTVLAYIKIRSARPRINILPGEVRDGILFFDIEVINAGDTSLNVVDVKAARKKELGIRLLPIHDGSLSIEQAAAILYDMRSERRSRFIVAQQKQNYRVNINATAPFLLMVILWERPEWLIPFPLPRFVFITRRKLSDIGQTRFGA